METTNLTDITNASDLVLDAFLAFRTGDAAFDFDALTAAELRALARMLPGANLRTWILLAEQAEDSRRTVSRATGDYYEGRILARQERDGWSE